MPGFVETGHLRGARSKSTQTNIVVALLATASLASSLNIRVIPSYAPEVG